MLNGTISLDRFAITRAIAVVAVLAFPTLVNLVAHAGSTILILLALMGFVLAISTAGRITLSRKEKWLVYAVTAYLLVYVLSLATHSLAGAAEPKMSYLEKPMRMFFFVPIYLLLRWIGLKEWVLWSGMALGALTAGVHAFWHVWIFPGSRPTGSYHNIAFGDLSLVMAFISVAGLRFFRQIHPAYVAIPATAFVLGVGASFLSGTRGAWAAIPALLLIVSWHSGTYLKMFQRIIVLVGLSSLIFIGYKFAEDTVDSRIQQTIDETAAFISGKVEEKDWSVRLGIWKGTVKIIRDGPLLGIGESGYRQQVRNMIAKGELDPVLETYRPHNMYLAVMVESGILGLAALLAVFAVPLWMFLSSLSQRNTVRDVGFAGITLILAFMHFAVSESVFERNVFVSFYVLALSAMLAAALGQRRNHGTPASRAPDEP